MGLKWAEQGKNTDTSGYRYDELPALLAASLKDDKENS